MKIETQEKLMRSYLLGNISEAEASSLEEEFFTDDERFEQLWEIENMLVDSYVRGRLSPEDREKFERHYLASPVHIERVAFARGLIEKADSLGTKAPAVELKAPRSSWLARLSEIMGLSPAAWRVAMAAAMLLLVVASIWLLAERARLRNQFEQLRTENQAQRQTQQELSDQIAAGRGESEKLTAEIERLRAEQSAATEESTSPQEGPSPRSILSFVLSPMLTRSSSDPQTLALSATTDRVRLQMRLPQTDARRFHVGVRTIEGKPLWNQQLNKPRANNSLLTIQIPANQLKVEDYFLTLSALNSKGELEELERYFFRVVMVKK
jgi:hypothetical protein